MAKFIVKGTVKYNGVTYASGSVVEVEKKDEKEFKKFGWEIVKEGKEGEEKGENLSKLTNDELKAKLTEKGIEFPEDAKKANLIALLEG